MITLGVILLIAGFVLKVSILWTLGIVALVVGAILADPGQHRTRHRWPSALLLIANPSRRDVCSAAGPVIRHTYERSARCLSGNGS